MAFLEIKNFNKTFSGNVKALDDINLALERGKVLSIIGHSGSGKTTLLRCINFLTELDSGEMILDGETLINTLSEEKVTEKELREKRLNFGMVFQSFNLFPQYTVKDNICLAPMLMLKEKYKKDKKNIDFNLEKKKIEEDARTLLDKIGLTDKANAYPCELSGGQSQRVAIARALALNPKVLCFDEPTSALDPELTGEVLKVIKSLKQKDRTMIIVTHEMSFAKNVSDYVVFMADGKIVEQGKPKDLFNNPQTENLKIFLDSSNKEDL
ncbi:MAG: amino acid ABC transporter ATP-binding protein [Clostridia bacterium]|nr:amino acid ABC transporter ATP-binding protein [Clostridia bacterium]